ATVRGSAVVSLLLSFSVRRAPPRPTLFPYTTLFRSSTVRPHSPAPYTPKYGAGPSGYTWVKRHESSPVTPTSSIAVAAAASTAAFSAGNMLHVQAVSKVSTIIPRAASASRWYGIRMNEDLHDCAASPVERSTPVVVALSVWVTGPVSSPEWSRAVSSARPIHGCTGWSAAPTRRTRAELVDPALGCASTVTSRGQFDGASPDWDSSRTASTPRSDSANATEAVALQRGLGWTRNQASVITPRIPSDPRNIRSG